MGEMRGQMQTLVSALKTASDERNEDHAELQSVKCTADDVEKKLRADLDLLQDETTMLESERDSKAAKWKELEKERDGLKAERDSLKDEVAASHELVGGLRTRCEAAESKECSEREDNASLKAALYAAQQTTKSWMSKFQIADDEVERVKKELDAALHLVEGGATKLQEADKERETLQKELRSALESREALGSKYESEKRAAEGEENLRRKRDALRFSAEGWQFKYEAASNECSRLKAELAGLRKFAQTWESLSEQSKRSQDEIEGLRSQIGHLQNSVAFWKAKLQTANGTISTEIEKRKALEANISAALGEPQSALTDSRTVHLEDPVEPPPDSWAAHVDELPIPGSRVFDAQDALALGTIYGSMDPDTRQELENLREDFRALASQNENLDAYSKIVYDDAATKPRSWTNGPAAEPKTGGVTELRPIQHAAYDAEKTAKDISLLKDEVPLVRAERDSKGVEADALRNQLLIAKDLETNLRRTIANLVAELDAINVERNELQTVSLRLREGFRALQGDKDALCGQLHEAVAQRRTLENEHDGLKTQLKNLMDDRDLLEAAQFALRDEWRAVHDKNDTLRDQLLNAETERDALRSAEADRARKAAVLSHQAERTSSEVEQLRSQLNHRQNSVNFWKAQSQAHHQKMEALESELPVLRAARDRLKNAFLESTRATSLQTELQAVLQRVQEYKREVSEWESKNKALDSARKKNDVECEQLKAEIRKVQASGLEEVLENRTKASVTELENQVAGLQR
ncbi:hypothetical protein AURDEDRAFT_166046 [Auricularia subglabra TFB-10046 SS5]|nr:hypothetical protein AURDEDRAFT_166046 [Auricularia subglabra TFB-10046 SS5]